MVSADLRLSAQDTKQRQDNPHEKDFFMAGVMGL